ncbi:MAG: PepSY domain-containing protein [Methylococcales bacterium]|nr:PepSY domain-containing protein [Methylococcales bacterium]
MKSNKNLIWRFLYKLHRYIGLSSAAVLIVVSITGIALNHTEDLKLDSQMIASNTILDWYGVNFSGNLTSFSTQNHWLTQLDQQLFFDDISIIKNKEILLGAIETDEFIVTGLSNSLLLLSLQGELIEQTSFENIEKLGIDAQNNIIIKSNQDFMFSDDGLLSWRSYLNPNNLTITWSKSTPPPKVIAQKIKNISRTSIIPLERVTLDLHSGRFFGLIGIIIVDISGLFLIILSISGCMIWLKHKLRKSNRNRKDS